MCREKKLYNVICRVQEKLKVQRLVNTLKVELSAQQELTLELESNRDDAAVDMATV